MIGYKSDAVHSYDDNTFFLNKSRLIFSIPLIVHSLFKLKPKIVFSSFPHINIFTAFLSIFFKDIKFVCRESSVLSSMNKFSNNNNIQDILIKYLYPNFINIICQSIDMKNDLIKNYNISADKLIVINNPITNIQKFNIESQDFEKKSINFITVGRLSPEKGHLRIIENLSRLKNFDFCYKIIGDGYLKADIIDLLKSKEIFDKVIFIKESTEILKHLFSADLFLQGSYVEGFPNAVLESCAVGTPVLAYDVPGGTKEIIRDNFNGYLVKHDNHFIQFLNDFPSKKINFNRKKMSDDILKRFGENLILNKYKDFLKSLTVKY